MGCVEQEKQLLASVPVSDMVFELEAVQETLGETSFASDIVSAVVPGSAHESPEEHGTMVTEVSAVDVSITGNVVGMLQPDTSVEVLESLANDRLRARMADPQAYLSLQRLSNGYVALPRGVGEPRNASPPCHSRRPYRAGVALRKGMGQWLSSLESRPVRKRWHQY